MPANIHVPEFLIFRFVLCFCSFQFQKFLIPWQSAPHQAILGALRCYQLLYIIAAQSGFDNQIDPSLHAAEARPHSPLCNTYIPDMSNGIKTHNIDSEEFHVSVPAKSLQGVLSHHLSCMCSILLDYPYLVTPPT